jgi:sterol desaturase/sphingolipid hydroxylase (fatty acid hydroxylase superfamily)
MAADDLDLGRPKTGFKRPRAIFFRLGSAPRPGHIQALMSIESLLQLKTLLVGGVLVLFVLYERLRPAAESPLLLRFGRAGLAAWRRLWRNLGLFGLNLLISPLVVLPITVFAADHSIGLRPAWWQGWPGLVLDLVFLDLWIYWWHRANHEIPLLWRFHSVHHLDETLDTTSALRFHFGEVLLSALVRAVVIVLFDIPLASVLLFEALVLASAIFHHSDAALPAGLERALSRVIITPSIHWVHHHAIQEDTDSNYGTIFSFWDPLFRSASATRRFAAMPIGIEGLKDRPFVRLILTPLRRCDSAEE